MKWGLLFVLLHNVFYYFGWYTDFYNPITTIKNAIGVISFGHVEGLVIPTWYLQSLFKGLIVTYLICCIPTRWIQCSLVVLLYLLSCYCDSRGIHLFYSMNRDMGVVIAIYLGYQLKGWNNILKPYQTLLCFLALLVGAFFVDIDLVGGLMGPIGTFPLFTIVGTLFVYNIVLLIKQYSGRLNQTLSWLGRNSLYILILHFTAFHILSLILVFAGVGQSSELSYMTTLGSINHSFWWIPYTIFGTFLPLLYVFTKENVKHIIWK